MFNNRFCYRIAKEAQIGWDEELKDYCEDYIQTTFQAKKEIPVELKTDMVESLKTGLASQLDTNVEYLQYIEPDEYDQYVED